MPQPKHRSAALGVVLGLACTVLVTACATTTSSTGRKQYVGGVSQQQLDQLGAQAFAEQKAKKPLTQDGKQSAYVRCVVDAIVRELPPQWQQGGWDEAVFVDKNPNGIVSEMKKQYFRSMYVDDIGAVQDVEPLMLVQYTPGVALIVKKVQIDRDHVRLYFHKVGEDELATTLTVKFPTPLSKEFTESPLIDDAISRFVTRQ